MIYSGKYKVTSPFGQRILNGQLDDHKGIDVVGITNKTITAVASGVVGASTIITDRKNRAMAFINNDITKALLMILALLVIVQSVLLIRTNRKRQWQKYSEENDPGQK